MALTPDMIRLLWIGGETPAEMHDGAAEGMQLVNKWVEDLQTALELIVTESWTATMVDYDVLTRLRCQDLRRLSDATSAGQLILRIPEATPLSIVTPWINAAPGLLVVVEPADPGIWQALLHQVVTGTEEAEETAARPRHPSDVWMRLELGRLTQLATTDQLTGLLRREELNRNAITEIQRARRTGQPLVCIMGDIDHFKRINDLFGHEAGDRALRHVSALLGRDRRSYDLVGRWGGEEFMLIMPGPSLAEGCQIAERLRRAIENFQWSTQSLPTLTMSFGVAELQEGALEDLAALSAAADAALYEAKRRGRNQVRSTRDVHAPAEEAAETGEEKCERLLIVDDAPIYLEELTRLLGSRYHVDSSSSPMEALLWVQDHDYDLVISDQNMPGMQGHELLARVKALQPQTVRILMTSHADMVSAIHAINEGEVYRYILKPWRDEDLMLTVYQALEHRMMVQRLRNSDRDTVKALAGAIELKDRHTKGHYYRVAEISLQIGTWLGYGENRLGMLEYGAWLHDVGKIGIPDGILSKRNITRTEERVMQEHPILGARLTASIDHLAPIAPFIRHHHERWDGLGYPDGLAGEKIPEEARIIAIANTYDGMVMPRGDAPGLTPQQAKEKIGEARGTIFDPRLVDVFLGMAQGAPAKC